MRDRSTRGATRLPASVARLLRAAERHAARSARRDRVARAVVTARTPKLLGAATRLASGHGRGAFRAATPAATLGAGASPERETPQLQGLYGLTDTEYQWLFGDAQQALAQPGVSGGIPAVAAPQPGTAASAQDRPRGSAPRGARIVEGPGAREAAPAAQSATASLERAARRLATKPDHPASGPTDAPESPVNAGAVEAPADGPAPGALPPPAPIARAPGRDEAEIPGVSAGAAAPAGAATDPSPPAARPVLTRAAIAPPKPAPRPRVQRASPASSPDAVIGRAPAARGRLARRALDAIRRSLGGPARDPASQTTALAPQRPSGRPAIGASPTARSPDAPRVAARVMRSSVPGEALHAGDEPGGADAPTASPGAEALRAAAPNAQARSPAPDVARTAAPNAPAPSPTPDVARTAAPNAPAPSPTPDVARTAAPNAPAAAAETVRSVPPTRRATAPPPGDREPARPSDAAATKPENMRERVPAAGVVAAPSVSPSGMQPVASAAPRLKLARARSQPRPPAAAPTPSRPERSAASEPGSGLETSGPPAATPGPEARHVGGDPGPRAPALMSSTRPTAPGKPHVEAFVAQEAAAPVNAPARDAALRPAVRRAPADQSPAARPEAPAALPRPQLRLEPRAGRRADRGTIGAGQSRPPAPPAAREGLLRRAAKAVLGRHPAPAGPERRRVPTAPSVVAPPARPARRSVPAAPSVQPPPRSPAPRVVLARKASRAPAALPARHPGVPPPSAAGRKLPTGGQPAIAGAPGPLAATAGDADVAAPATHDGAPPTQRRVAVSAPAAPMVARRADGADGSARPLFGGGGPTLARAAGGSGGDSGSGGTGDADAIYDEILRRLRCEQEQLGQVIDHPF